MRALVIKEGGGLVVEDRPVPEPGDHDVLVRVAGAGINRADLLQRAGRYPAPPGAPPDIPGLEFSGVVEGAGTAALQLAESLGAAVAGTSRTQDKLDRAAKLGLAHPVLAPSGFDPAALAAEITAAAGPIDVTVDLVGGPYLGVDVAAAAAKGRIVIVGLIAGGRAELDMGALLAKRLVVRGTVLRSRPSPEKADATHLFEGQVVPLLARGTIKPVIDAVVPLADAERAYDLVAADGTFGKVVLDLR